VVVEDGGGTTSVNASALIMMWKSKTRVVVRVAEKRRNILYFGVSIGLID